MITDAFYTAMANVLVSHDLMHALHHDPEQVRSRYALSGDELALLRSATPGDLHLSREIVRGKRFRALEVLLPHTMRILVAAGGAELIAGYVDDVLRRPDVDMLRMITQGHDFVGWLGRRSPTEVPDGLLDLARFEVAVADLRGDADAARAARAASDGTVPPMLRDGPQRPLLAPDARVELFDTDVLALSRDVSPAGLAAAAHRPTAVLLRKRWDVPLPVFYRLGAGTAELLRSCDGRHTVGAVLDRVVGADPLLRDRAVDALRRAAQAALISVPLNP